MTDQDCIELVKTELTKARNKHKNIRVRHEGYAVILEELDEVKEVIWHDESDDKLRKELIQVAAVAIRTLVDLKLA